MVGVEVPVGIVVVIFLGEALGVWHEAEGAAGGVLESGDGEGGAVKVFGVGQGDVAVGEVGFGIAGEGDEAAFGMGNGELELGGQALEVGAGGVFDLELGPAADEALAGVVDEAACGQDSEFGEDLEAVADAKGEAAAGVMVLDGIAEFGLGDKLGETTGHDVVAVGKAAGKHYELGFFDLGDGGIGDGDDRGGKADELECAGGFGITVGAWIFQQGGVRHERLVGSGLVKGKRRRGNRNLREFGQMVTGGLVDEGIVGGIREELVVGGEIAESGGPEGGIVGEAEEIVRCWGNDPSVVFEFVFELAGAPAGVADKGADEGAGFFVMLDGVFGRNLLDDSQAAGLIPPECGENQVVFADWTAVVDADVAEWMKFGGGQKIADDLAGGLVEDESEGSVFGIVLREQDDGVVKGATGEGRGCE